MTESDNIRHQELDDFTHEAQFALVGYQMVEEQLKSYICTAYKLIRNRTSDLFPFKYEDEEVDNYAMEKLINIFKKINENSELIQKLQKLPNNRNYIAHQAFAHAYVKRTAHEESLEEETKKVKEMREYVWQCFQEFRVILEDIELKSKI